MKKQQNTAPHLELLDFPLQERLALAWVVASSTHFRCNPTERMYQRCQEAASQLSNSDCQLLLSEIPALQF